MHKKVEIEQIKGGYILQTGSYMDREVITTLNNVFKKLEEFFKDE